MTEKQSQKLRLAYAEGRKKPAVPMLGKHHSEETKKRLSEHFKNNPSNYWLGRKDYPIKGSNHPFWKGDNTKTKIKERIRKLFQYRQWRSDIFTRDDYTCQICSVRGGELNADHFPKTLAEIVNDNNITDTDTAILCEELWNINNGRTLCFPCHKKTPTYLKGPLKTTK